MAGVLDWMGNKKEVQEENKKQESKWDGAFTSEELLAAEFRRKHKTGIPNVTNSKLEAMSLQLSRNKELVDEFGRDITKRKNKYSPPNDINSSSESRRRYSIELPPKDPIRHELDEERHGRYRKQHSKRLTHLDHRSKSRSCNRRSNSITSRRSNSRRSNSRRRSPSCRRSNSRRRRSNSSRRRSNSYRSSSSSRECSRSRSNSRERSKRSRRKNKNRRSQSRSKSSSDHNYKKRWMKWSHDKFHTLSPSPEKKADPNYQPPMETWVSRAGGVYIPKI